MERQSHTRLRAKVRAFLPLELVNSTFEAGAELSTEYSWPLLIKVKLLLTSSSIQIEGLHGCIDGVSFANVICRVVNDHGHDHISELKYQG